LGLLFNCIELEGSFWTGFGIYFGFCFVGVGVD
jgi:hypothetical protein